MILVFSQTPRLALRPTQYPSVGIRVKKPGFVVDHTLPTNANVKNKWNCTSIFTCVVMVCTSMTLLSPFPDTFFHLVRIFLQ